MSKNSLLVSGNTKTGPGVGLFNLPRLTTCPGASALCKRVCYGKVFRRFPGVEARYEENKKRSLEASFVTDMIEEIKARKFKVIRVHAIGDFYDGAYVGKWIAIARALPGVVFYCYTRSWRKPEIRRTLLRLQRLGNVALWWSTDRETGPAPEGLTAYMSMDDTDVAPFDVSMIFRVKRKDYRATVGGVRVCPKERCQSDHPKYPAALTCHTCKVCFRHAVVKPSGLMSQASHAPRREQ